MLPYDCLSTIFNFLDEISFIKFIVTSKYFYKYKLAKKLENHYKFSKIIHMINNYHFTNIIYDMPKLDISKLSNTINCITFDSVFDDLFDDIYNMKNIKFINVVDYDKLQSIYNVPNRIVNKYDLIIHVIVHNYFNNRGIKSIDVDQYKIITIVINFKQELNHMLQNLICDKKAIVK